jgi:hypothetical protein
MPHQSNSGAVDVPTSHRATYQEIIETAAEMVEDDQGKPGVGGAG